MWKRTMCKIVVCYIHLIVINNSLKIYLVSSTAMNTPGADIYTFQNKKKLNRVQCETPKSNKKPTNDNLHKTPYILRKKLKQGD